MLQADGRIVVLGTKGYPPGADFVVARYDTGGVLDTAFGTGGTVTTDLGGAEIAHAVLLQPDGRIVAAGGYDNPVLVRYLDDGLSIRVSAAAVSW